MLWPLPDHILTRDFYYKAALYVGGQHAAVDLIRRLATTLRSLIVAVADGMVIGDAWDPYSGYFIGVRHADGWISFYRHLYSDAPPVRGQFIRRGQTIGYIGSTGASMGPHLHFDLWNERRISPEAFYKNGYWAHDPLLYLGKEGPHQEEDEDMKLWLIVPNPPDEKGSVYVTDGVHKRRANRMLNNLAGLKGVMQNTTAIQVSPDYIAWLIDF